MAHGGSSRLVSGDGRTMTDFEKMTDEEVEAYLAAHQAPKPAARGVTEYSWFLIIAGLVGIFASFQLLLGERELEADPYANLACDVNEILACSTFLTSWEGSVLGFSNSYLGIASFGAMALLGVYLLLKKHLPSFMWVALLAGSAFAFLALLWFQYTSFIEAGTLCPWCLVIWACLIPFIVLTVGQAHANLARPTSWVWRMRWPIVALWILGVVVFAFVYFYDTWAFIFGWSS